MANERVTLNQLPRIPSAASNDLIWLSQFISPGVYQDRSIQYNNLISDGGNTVWGQISGTLSNQTDLQNALNAKADFNVTAVTTPANGISLSAANTLGLNANTAPVLELTNPASAINYFTATGSATTAAPSYITLAATGGDSHVGIQYNSLGTTTSGAQYNGFFGTGGSTTGEQIFNIAGVNALELTDTYWNPNISYQGATNCWVVISSGALAGGPDTSAVIAAKSSIYPGTATGATLRYHAQGPTGAHHFVNNGFINFTVFGSTNPNGNDKFITSNFVGIIGTAAGTNNNPAISVQNADATVGLDFYTGGSGNMTFSSDNASTTLFKMNRVASGVNHLETTVGIAGNGAILAAAGVSTNIPILITPKGAANIVTTGVEVTGTTVPTDTGMYHSASGTLSFATNGAKQFGATGSASNVNYINLQGSTTGSSVFMSTAGSDTNAGFILSSKGTGALSLRTNSGGTVGLQIVDVASAVNHLQINAAITGSAPSISASGTDTNVDLKLTPQGTGVVEFGAFTVLGAETLSGYITIKDNTGTLRKIGVIA